MAIYVLYMGYNRLKMTFELPTGIMFLSAFWRDSHRAYIFQADVQTAKREHKYEGRLLAYHADFRGKFAYNSCCRRHQVNRFYKDRPHPWYGFWSCAAVGFVQDY